MHNRMQLILLLLGSISLLLFAGIAADVEVGGFLKSVDLSVLNFLQKFKNDFLDKLMTAISFLGDGRLLLSASILISLIFFWKKSFWLGICFLILVFLNGLIIKALKWSFHIKRPEIAGGILPASELYRSFPSGHVSLSVVFFGFSAFLVATLLTNKERYLPYGIAAAFIFLIALSRLYLGVHWLSDVMGAFFFGLFCVLLAIVSYQRRFKLMPSKTV